MKFKELTLSDEELQILNTQLKELSGMIYHDQSRLLEFSKKMQVLGFPHKYLACDDDLNLSLPGQIMEIPDDLLLKLRDTIVTDVRTDEERQDTSNIYVVLTPQIRDRLNLQNVLQKMTLRRLAKRPETRIVELDPDNTLELTLLAVN